MIRSLITALALLTVASRGDAAEQSALLLSFVENGGSDVAPYLKPVAESLSNRGSVLWGQQLAKEMSRLFGPSPALLDTDKQASMKDEADKVEQGLLLGNVSPETAIRKLEDFRRQVVERPGSIALEPTARDLYAQILLTLVRAYQLKHQASNASSRMSEFVLGFTDRPLDTSSNIAPSVLELYRQISTALSKERHGTLRVDKRDASGKLFVNGTPSQVAKALSLPHGEYAVFVSTVSGDSRMHSVAIGEGDVTLGIDVPFEVSLATDKFVGLHFDDQANQERGERRAAEKIGKALDLGRVYVLSQVITDGKPSLRLRVYSLPEGQLTATVAMLGGVLTPAQVTELAQRLVQKAGAAPPAPSRSSTLRSIAPSPSIPSVTGPTAKRVEAAPAPAASASGDFTEAYVRADYVKAILLSERAAAKDGPERLKALRVLGASHCALGHADKAREAWKQLDENGRTFLKYVCQRSGIGLQ